MPTPRLSGGIDRVRGDRFLKPRASRVRGVCFAALRRESAFASGHANQCEAQNSVYAKSKRHQCQSGFAGQQVDQPGALQRFGHFG